VELRSTAPDVFTRSYAGDVYNTAVYLKRSLPDARRTDIPLLAQSFRRPAMVGALARVVGPVVDRHGPGSLFRHFTRHPARGRLWAGTSRAGGIEGPSAAGCLVLDQGSVTRLDNPHAPTVVDTSGAGDAFNGAYLAATLRGASPIAAANEGLMLGARVVSHAGAVVPASISHGEA